MTPPRKLTAEEIEEFANEYANRLFDFMVDKLMYMQFMDGDAFNLKYEITIQVKEDQRGTFHPFIDTVH